MEVNYKNDITLRICKELKSRGLKIDYELYYKVMKMVYRSHGKQSEHIVQKEVDEYKKSVNGNDYEYNSRSQFKNNEHNDNKPRNKYYNNYTTYNNFNSSGNKSEPNTGNNGGRWRKI